ncbi:class I SAM-dependent methyltransferase [Paenibacillus sp. NPDC058071]|uniref:class I SAM-dependent methyltransferase n=1 Tax=Paenibacillus sp. NPDC058071 TaxID=3346326 RepID=UPI0036DCAE71
MEPISINLKYYSGTDHYSDGDVEDELLEIVKRSDSYTEILRANDKWPILYHLTPLRRNLLEWYPFKDGASLLEIGAGCGALTGLFCEKVEKVVAVELSKRRAEIISNRCKGKHNLEIIVGNLNDIEFDQKFDYITLIGVLEYAGKYTEGPHPHKSFIEAVKSLLKPDGMLIIAIENKYGLKYWAGAREDHSGQLFESIEGYNEKHGVETFSRMDMEQLLKSVGLSETRYYYPVPDYKLPHQVYSDEYLPKPGEIKNSPNYDRSRYQLFDEQSVVNGLIDNKQFPFFSNSFLIFTNQGGK